MKDAFRKSMVYVYPLGVAEMASKFQLRDLVKVFSMGYLESLSDLNTFEATQRAVLIFPEIKVMTDVDWFPDSSWHWDDLCK